MYLEWALYKHNLLTDSSNLICKMCLWQMCGQFSSVAQSCPTLCDPMDCSTPGLPVHHQLPEFTQTLVNWVGDVIQPPHPLSSPSPPTFNLSQHQGLFKRPSPHQVVKVLCDIRQIISFCTSVCSFAQVGNWQCNLHGSFSLSLCKPNVVHHFFCDIPAVMALSCSDKHVREVVLVLISSFDVFFALLVIFISYLLIFITVLKMHSAKGYQKALSTCASHLSAVSIFCGTIIFMYLRPSSNHSMDTDKVASVFYAVVIPMLNPVVYSLRSKEVQSAFKKVWGKAKSSLGFQSCSKYNNLVLFLLSLSIHIFSHEVHLIGKVTSLPIKNLLYNKNKMYVILELNMSQVKHKTFWILLLKNISNGFLLSHLLHRHFLYHMTVQTYM